jgi:hypothetical protein
VEAVTLARRAMAEAEQERRPIDPEQKKIVDEFDVTLLHELTHLHYHLSIDPRQRKGAAPSWEYLSDPSEKMARREEMKFLLIRRGYRRFDAVYEIVQIKIVDESGQRVIYEPQTPKVKIVFAALWYEVVTAHLDHQRQERAALEVQYQQVVADRDRPPRSSSDYVDKVLAGLSAASLRTRVLELDSEIAELESELQQVGVLLSDAYAFQTE